MYTVKSVKTWKGMEGLGTQCWFCRDGKKVARFTDDAHGGEARFDWVDYEAPRVTIQTESGSYKGTPEEARFHSHIKNMTYKYSGETHPMSPDVFVSDLCDEFDYRKKMKSRLKKTTYFRLKNQTYEKDAWSVMKAVFTPESKAFLVQRYGSNLGEILNETIQGE